MIALETIGIVLGMVIVSYALSVIIRALKGGK